MGPLALVISALLVFEEVFSLAVWGFWAALHWCVHASLIGIGSFGALSLGFLKMELILWTCSKFFVCWGLFPQFADNYALGWTHLLGLLECGGLPCGLVEYYVVGECGFL